MEETAAYYNIELLLLQQHKVISKKITKCLQLQLDHPVTVFTVLL